MLFFDSCLAERSLISFLLMAFWKITQEKPYTTDLSNRGTDRP